MKVTEHLSNMSEDVKQGIDKGMGYVAQEATGQIKRAIPKSGIQRQTGTLMNSWFNRRESWSRRIVRTSAYYAIFLNDGTRYITSRRFVEKAVTATQPRIDELIIRGLKEEGVR